MTTTACSFLKRVVTNYPELIGKEIFCSPSGNRYDVTCRLNEDGTISPVLAPADDDNDDNDDDDASSVVERFNTPLELIQALVDANCKRAGASSDLFLSRRRKDSLSGYIQKRREEQSNSTIADRSSTTNGDDAKRTRKCAGFSKLRGAFNVVGYNITSDCKMQIRIDDDDNNNVYRSVHCDGFIRARSKRARANCCRHCLQVKSRLESHRRSLHLDRLLCYGLKRRPKYEEAIARRQWDGARKDVSMVVRSGNRLFARQCDGRKEQSTSGSGFKCSKCWKVNRTLRLMAWHDRNRAANKMTTSGGTTTTTSSAAATENEEERRIMHARKATLSKLDLEKKEKILQRRHEDQVKKLRAELKKTQAELTRVAAKFVPTHAENRKAVASVVAYLNQETDRIKNPICKWRTTTTSTTTTTTTECAHPAESCVALLVHVNDVHLVVEPSLRMENQAVAEPEEERSNGYYCRWTNCNRQRPFDTYAHLYAHVKEHTGTKDTQIRLEILRNQLINANRSKTGRRHTEAAKHLALAQYRNCRSSGKRWDAAWQNYSGGFPVITRKTLRVMELKEEAGGGGGEAANDGDDNSISQEHNYFQL